MDAGSNRDAMRALVRHQWVREHGTPRITVLVGPAAVAGELWLSWLRLGGRALGDGDQPGSGVLLAQPQRAVLADWLDTSARRAARLVEDRPALPVAIAVEPGELARWRAARADRIAALIGEGIVEIDEVEPAPEVVAAAAPRSTRARGGAVDTPRSLAELTLHEALEATPATAGRFRLNQRISVRFGGTDAEIDVLSREDAIAIEVDGIHHFADPDCYRRDRRKDALLQAHGLAVLRFLAEDVLADPRAAVRTVCELLAARRTGDR